MTIFLGSLLSFTRMHLGPIQKKQVEIDTKKKILGAVMDISKLTSDEVLSLYNEKMKSIVIDLDGEEIIQDDGSKLVAACVENASHMLILLVRIFGSKD